MNQKIVELNNIRNLSNSIILFHQQSGSIYSVSKDNKYFNALLNHSGLVEGVAAANISDELKSELDILLDPGSEERLDIADCYDMIDYGKLNHQLLKRVNTLPQNVLIELIRRKFKLKIDGLVDRPDLSELLNKYNLIDCIDRYNVIIYNRLNPPICCNYIDKYIVEAHRGWIKRCCAVHNINNLYVKNDIIKPSLYNIVDSVFKIEGIVNGLKRLGQADTNVEVIIKNRNIRIISQSGDFSYTEFINKTVSGLFNNIVDLKLVIDGVEMYDLWDF